MLLSAAAFAVFVLMLQPLRKIFDVDASIPCCCNVVINQAPWE